MYKTKKGSKDIIKIVHQWFNLNFYEATRTLFVRKENRNNDFIQQFLLFCVSLRCTFTTVPWCMRLHSSPCNQGAAHLVSMPECRLLRQQHHIHASWYCSERTLKTDTEEIIIFVFFARFMKFRLNHWWTILMMSLLPFLVLNVSVALLSMQS